MKLRLSLLVLSVAIALGAVVGDSIAKRRAAIQNAMLYAVGTPQAVGNTDASAGRKSNKNEKGTVKAKDEMKLSFDVVANKY
jgi:hypothetical protein